MFREIAREQHSFVNTVHTVISNFLHNTDYLSEYRVKRLRVETNDEKCKRLSLHNKGPLDVNLMQVGTESLHIFTWQCLIE